MNSSNLQKNFFPIISSKFPHRCMNLSLLNISPRRFNDSVFPFFSSSLDENDWIIQASRVCCSLINQLECISSFFPVRLSIYHYFLLLSCSNKAIYRQTMRLNSFHDFINQYFPSLLFCLISLKHRLHRGIRESYLKRHKLIWVVAALFPISLHIKLLEYKQWSAPSDNRT